MPLSITNTSAGCCGNFFLFIFLQAPSWSTRRTRSPRSCTNWSSSRSSTWWTLRTLSIMSGALWLRWALHRHPTLCVSIKFRWTAWNQSCLCFWPSASLDADGGGVRSSGAAQGLHGPLPLLSYRSRTAEWRVMTIVCFRGRSLRISTCWAEANSTRCSSTWRSTCWRRLRQLSPSMVSVSETVGSLSSLVYDDNTWLLFHINLGVLRKSS